MHEAQDIYTYKHIYITRPADWEGDQATENSLFKSNESNRALDLSSLASLAASKAIIAVGKIAGVTENLGGGGKLGVCTKSEREELGGAILSSAMPGARDGEEV